MGKNIYFVGNFPPPYGGVTVRNSTIVNELKKHVNLDIFNISSLKNNKLSYFKLLFFLIKNYKHSGIFSISSDIGLFRITKLIYCLRKKYLENITVFVAGGKFHEFMLKFENTKLIDIFKGYKNIFVQSNKMVDALQKMGLTNVYYLPNMRVKPDSRKLYFPDNGTTLKLLFFSLICEEKGVSNIIETAKILKENNKNFIIDFYGPISEKYKSFFDSELRINSCLKYKGVFKSGDINVYDVLKEYDFLLFPTMHAGEGFPGILVEAKIAGLPVIASDWKFNADIIKHLYDGIILSENTSKELSKVILELYDNKEMKNNMRKNSFDSAENYFIDNYVQFIIEKV